MARPDNGASSAKLPNDPEIEHLLGGVPCGDHVFDDALVCRCGVNWWTHQRAPKTCPVNARGRNRGDEDLPETNP
ncbi:hypothetical protein MK489_04870 [Myxococcota bacterium]|nr:hypothetical protein [Myxococcota bacterium]